MYKRQGKRKNGTAADSTVEESFGLFWNEYHETTRMPRQNRELSLIHIFYIMVVGRGILPKGGMKRIRHYPTHVLRDGECRPKMISML